MTLNTSAFFVATVVLFHPIFLHAQTTPPADVIISGEESDNLGWSVSGVGDVNNDGIDDLLVGAPASPALADFAGRAFLFFGPLSDNLASTDADVIFNPEGAFGDNFGISVAGAGDVNNDGNDDILIGARSSDAGGIQSGKAYLYLGPFSAGVINPPEADAVFIGDAFDELGWSVAGAGDVNNDGFDDIMLGCPQALSSLGRILLFHGPLSGSHTPDDADASVQGQIADERLGSSIAGAGDVNNDGFDDMIIGQFSPLIGNRNAGRALLFLGPVAGSLSAGDADAQIIGEVIDDRFGLSVAAAGDINLDGNADLVIGADQFFSSGRGRAYLFLGPLQGIVPAGDAEAIIRGEGADDLFGTSVGSAGDVNGDGVPDLLVGASGGGDAGAGSGYLFYGPLEGPVLAGEADVILEEQAGGGWFGNSIAGSGDLNGDGRRDIIVGAPLSDFAAAEAGRTYLFSLGIPDAIPCEDVVRVRAKCHPAGRVLIKVNLVPGSGHEGKILEFLVDSTVPAQAVVMNDRAGVQVTVASGASHSVELVNPAACVDPIAVICSSGDLVADAETDNDVLPASTSLLQNYPNPFNPETAIRYSLERDARVSLKLYDVMGREVRTLVDGFLEAGWHEVRLDASSLAGGMYYYRLRYGDIVLTKAMMLVK